MTAKQLPFSGGQLEALCKALADTDKGLTGTEIGHVLQQVRMADVTPELTKWKRLFNALSRKQNAARSGVPVLNFIHHALEPSRYAGRLELFRDRLRAVNVPLAFAGLEFGEDGKFHRCDRAATLGEAEYRADQLRFKLEQRGVDPDVLEFCRAELLEDNYFHAVLEATKSVATKLRTASGLTSDGAELVQGALGGTDPILRINRLATDTDRGEQRGFTNLLIGLFGTFRNPPAHAARIEWNMDEQDALDVLSLLSYVHRRLRRVSNNQAAEAKSLRAAGKAAELPMCMPWVFDGRFAADANALATVSKVKRGAGPIAGCDAASR